MGRPLDAVSAILGICDRTTFEGEAAIALEALATADDLQDYPVDIGFKDPMSVDFSPTILAILNELADGVETSRIATRFHNTVAAAIVGVVSKIALTTNIRDVAISGGVFQNRFLTALVINGLRGEGLDVYANELVPCNDAGLSLGQAYILRERIRAGIL